MSARLAVWILIGLGLAPHRAAAAPDPSEAGAPAASLAGEWGMEIETGDHTEEAVLRFTQVNGILAGTISREGSPPRELSRLGVAGDRISFDIDEPAGTEHATGTVTEKLMTGKMKRQGEGGGGFSFGGHRETRGDSDAGRSHRWTAYKRPDASPPPPPAPAAASPAAGTAGDSASDHRFRVSHGTLAGSEPLRLTPAGEATDFTPSFSIPEGRFVPDPYAVRCRLVAAKSTIRAEDQKTVLGDRYVPSGPEDEDPLVLHPVELRNAAPRFGANAVYLLLSDSEALEKIGDLRDCTIVSKDGERYRGELLEEVECRSADGKPYRFSRYAGRASFYSCPPDHPDSRRGKSDRRGVGAQGRN